MFYLRRLCQSNRKLALVIFFEVLAIIAVGLWSGCRSLNTPGVYYDAINPDYIGAIFAFPGVDNFCEISKFTYFPFLGHLYHGTFSAMIQFVVLKLFGSGSVALFRVSNVLIFLVVSILVYVIEYRISSNHFISFLSVVLLVSSDCVIGITRTQYYLMLHGTFFLLLSLFHVYKAIIDRKDNSVVWAGIFQGLAFYGYFSFLFFMPVSLVLLVCAFQNDKIRIAFAYFWSVILGSILYFWGYFDSAIINIIGKNEKQQMITLTGFILSLILLSVVPLSYLFDKRNRYIKKIIFVYGITLVMLLLGTIVAVGMYWNIICPKIISVLSMTSDLSGRNDQFILVVFVRLLYNLLSNTTAQSFMIGRIATDMEAFWPVCLFCLNAYVITIILRSKKHVLGFNKIEKSIIGINCYVIGYYISSLPLISKMQEQHLVPFLFIIFGLFGIELIYISEQRDKVFREQQWKKVTIAILCLGVLLNISNNKQLCLALDVTGGSGTYTDAINEFCIEANNEDNKKNTVYVFPEWGFYAPFIYLTSNTCKAIRGDDVNVDELKKYINEGKALKVVSWDNNKIDDVCDDINNAVSYEKVWHSRDGNIAFYERTYIKRGQ